MTEFEIELLSVLRNIHRALAELGFNGAITRANGGTQGIGERLVLLLEEHNAIQRQILDEAIGTDIDLDE